MTKMAPAPPSKTVQKKALPDAADNDVLEQLKNSKNGSFIEVQKNRIKLTNLDKELWPRLDKQPPLTKRDFLIYLTKVSPYLLEHMLDRPITLVRFPNGITGERFYQKHWNSPLPDFVKTVPLQEHREKRQDYLLCNNLSTMLWLGQVADLEFHTWFARVSSGPDSEVPAGLSGQAEIDFVTRYPDFMIFDLDPYLYAGTEPKGAEPELNRKGFAATCEAALWLKETLDKLSLAAFIKTSGKTGLHIYVPLLRQFDFHAVQSAAKTICGFVLQHHPKQITIDWTVARRSGKVFFDYNQNVRGKTLISIYSPRATPEATVSTPLRWDELGKVYPTDFTTFNVPERLSKLGDLWANILNAKSDLKGMLEESKGANK
ncbi:MAG: non-homologous end-joining DNA ligase [Chloroflexota bacterium]